MNNNFCVFLIGRRTARHSLDSNECGWTKNFLISMKADLRQTRLYSCSPSFCIVLVGAGVLEAHIPELNPHLPIILFVVTAAVRLNMFNCCLHPYKRYIERLHTVYGLVTELSSKRV